MPLRILPSVEVVAVAHLKASADVQAIAGDRVGTELYAGTTPAVWLTLVTGEERVRNHLVAPVLDVRSYGGNKATADLLARTVHAVMHDMPGIHPTGIVTHVGLMSGPMWLPDEGFEPPRPRYVGSYVVVLHPLPV